MSDARGARPSPPAPRPRFRCLGCRAFVIGTELGHCPRCGWVPPRAMSVEGAARGSGRLRRWLWFAVLAMVALAVLWMMSIAVFLIAIR